MEPVEFLKAPKKWTEARTFRVPTKEEKADSDRAASEARLKAALLIRNQRPLNLNKLNHSVSREQQRNRQFARKERRKRKLGQQSREGTCNEDSKRILRKMTGNLAFAD